jgi:transposase-like protein
LDPTRLLNPKLSDDFANNRDAALKAIIPAVRETKGNVAATARRLGISVDTLRRWMRREPKIQREFNEARIRAIRDNR